MNHKNVFFLEKFTSQHIVAILLFVGIFVTTINSAYMSGDDFVSISGIIWRDVYIPSFSKTWIPNRVFDPFGQAFFTLSLDVLYQALHSIANINIFWTHKLFSSLLFASFLTIIFIYISNNVAIFKDMNEGKTFNLLIYTSIAIGICITLPWKNHTHIISYEIPAFLSFILYLELTKLLIQKSDTSQQPRSSSFYLILIYICVFSLEAYTLILAGAFLILLTQNFIYKLNPIKKDLYKNCQPLYNKNFLIYITWFFALTLYSLFLILIFSERIRTPGQVGSGKFKLSIENIMSLQNNWLLMFIKSHGIFIFAIILSFVLIFILYTHRTKKLKSIGHVFNSPDCIRTFTNFFIALLISSFITVLLISKITGQNFFNHNIYPWGALFLVAKFYCIFYIACLTVNINSNMWPIKGAIALVLFIVCTQFLMIFFSLIEKNTFRSIAVNKAYNLTINGNKVIDTGLELHNIEGASLPFPTGDSPIWLKDTYNQMLKKYYSIETSPSYK